MGLYLKKEYSIILPWMLKPRWGWTLCLQSGEKILCFAMEEKSKIQKYFAKQKKKKTNKQTEDQSKLKLVADKKFRAVQLKGSFSLTASLFWDNGRAARIGRAILVCSIGHLPILEALPSLPPVIWQSRQRFRNKMVDAANKMRVEECSLLIWHLFLLSCANVRVFTFW